MMSTQLRVFLQECQVLLHDSRAHGDLAGLIVYADDAARRVFSRCELICTSHRQGFRRVVESSDARMSSDLASAHNTLLLPDPRAEPYALLPAHIYCSGPVWLESSTRWKGPMLAHAMSGSDVRARAGRWLYG